MSSECRCHTDENFCFYCEMYVPLERKCEQLAREIEQLRSHRVIKNYTDMMIECESQKAIAELAVKALKEINAKYMDYIENNIECDSAASSMDEIAEKALEEIKRLGEGVNK